MSERDDFLAWFDTTWRAAEVALHNGDAGPRFQTWSETEPVTLFGAWLNATDPASATWKVVHRHGDEEPGAHGGP